MQIYLDNNATTRTAPEVVEAMQPYWTERYGNPSSVHRFGTRVAHEVDLARTAVAGLIACRDSEIVFTSGGTESVHLAIEGCLRAQPHKKHIVTTAVEHSCVLDTVEYLTRQGYDTTILHTDTRGRLDLDALSAAIRDDTALVSVMWANNETGVILPISDIAALTAERGVLLHTDAVQAIGKLPVNVAESPVDLLSMAAHKFHGPKGVGALYVRRGTPFRPILRGGHQERSRRAGTENVPAIIGMARAVQLTQEHMATDVEHMRAMRDRLEQGILDAVPSARVHGDTDSRLVNTSNIGFAGVEGEALLLLLSEAGVFVSSGSACASGALEPSHVLTAMNIDEHSAHGAVRFSVSRETTADQIDHVLAILPDMLKRLEHLR